jgi:3-hydroxyisobutyrate dehydrogenase-like beta-hydroxyacid dehydrogenase
VRPDRRRLYYQAVGEALPLAHRAGADLAAIGGGAAGCWSLRGRADAVRGDFESGFLVAYQCEDPRIATRAGEEFGVPTPETQVAREMDGSTAETGLGRDDRSGVIRVIERLADDEERIG